jgi:putative hydrolase of HD superfamily
VEIPGADMNRCMKIALVHDLAEAIVGDITPNDGISKDEKRRLEKAAMEEICADRKDLIEFWQEYEDGVSLEAKIVKDFDKLEMILTAGEYENQHKVDLQEFFTSVQGKFHTPQIEEMANSIVAQRNKIIK